LIIIQVQNASQRAILLWKGRDAANVGYPVVDASQDVVRSVAGAGSTTLLLDSPDNHHVACNNCRLVRVPIFLAPLLPT